ncbi:hypothetical protein GH714_004126 [Hevea brasiliensis]|uniref:CRAL-TRIO domain-containing protein n=1 Tax=Hevea brasiliensis TaxID=3981 RepID=A0A6A6K594_HEVBR|nr:hypothetical protein GH714_004126 [Hevea brasiliensis]
MEDPPYSSGLSGNFEATSVAVRKKIYERNLDAYDPKAFPQSAHKHICSLGCSKDAGGAVGYEAIFLLKVAALETVRRVSRSKCLPVWRGLQALQVLCYPPFKWIQRWAHLNSLLKDDSMIRRTTDENPQSIESEIWMQLLKELENQGMALIERINEDELHKFFAAANGDFSCFLSSIKKTIRWRETYRILSEQELEMWSNMVFWHGFDVEDRPCVIVRLGLACLNLPLHERPRSAQAVISQVEHGVLHLVGKDNPQITVLVDCNGISP